MTTRNYALQARGYASNLIKRAASYPILKKTLLVEISFAYGERKLETYINLHKVESAMVISRLGLQGQGCEKQDANFCGGVEGLLWLHAGSRNSTVLRLPRGFVCVKTSEPWDSKALAGHYDEILRASIPLSQVILKYILVD